MQASRLLAALLTALVVIPFALAQSPLFVAVTPDAEAGEGPIAAAIGDFNRDGIADVAIADTDDETLIILIGNGDGTFETAVTYPT
ncbi:MAG TPA: VCBS repeat-containing protein, partial [Terriglobales bacterium]|nr:VCBS repeat-containing protein [Terriglobales bacterium]